MGCCTNPAGNSVPGLHSIFFFDRADCSVCALEGTGEDEFSSECGHYLLTLDVGVFAERDLCLYTLTVPIIA